MQRETGVADHPALDGRRLVGGVVVDDDVHVEVFGHVVVDQVEEPAELLGAMPEVRSAMTWPETTSRAA